MGFLLGLDIHKGSNSNYNNPTTKCGWYAKGLMTMIFLLTTPLFAPYLLNEWLDHKFELCSIRCRDFYGQTTYPSLDPTIVGDRSFGSDTCHCYQTSSSLSSKARKFLGSIDWRERRPPPSSYRGDEVCAADGHQYSTQQNACINQTYPLHSGGCGACSNTNDISVYYQTKSTMSLVAYECALKYLLGASESQTSTCFGRLGLSSHCNECWIQNMKCSTASCLSTCLWHNIMLKVPWSDASATLNPCIKCDEVNCGPTFVKCAGANRRRAGIVSDIMRTDAEVWNRTAC